MFERYTEKARRTIFYARYEAFQHGSLYIETEHLLLGLLREDHAIAHRFLGESAAEEMRKKITAQTPVRELVSTSVEMPLSNEGKRVLAYAAEEAERLSHKHIGTEHLFLGLLREEKSFAAVLLAERGVRLDEARRVIAQESSKSVDVSYVVAPPFPAPGRYHLAQPEIVLECGDATLGRLLSVGPLQRVPRIGEEIVLDGRSYRVDDVSSTFETPPQAPNTFLKKVTLKLKQS